MAHAGGAVFDAAGKASATNEGSYRRMECSCASYSYISLMGVRILRELRILRVEITVDAKTTLELAEIAE